MEEDFMNMEENQTCSYEDKNGTRINTCEDKPVITYCKKCNCVYAINQENGTRTELNLSIKELLDFIKERENSSENYTE